MSSKLSTKPSHGKQTKVCHLSKMTGIAGESAKMMLTVVGQGEIHILDDEGQSCTLKIPELYFCESVPYKLISPQHLDKMWQERNIGSFASTTDAKSTRLKWTDHEGETHTKLILHPCYQGYQYGILSLTTAATNDL
jgi:hypothetical protein